MVELAKRKKPPSAILEAAVRVFSRRGYMGATLNEVASEAGISKPTIYNHFRNKAELYEEMVRFVHRRTMELLELATAPCSSTKERIKEILRVQFQMTRDRADLIRVMHTLMYLPEEVRPRVNPMLLMEEKFGFIHKVVKKGVEEGELAGNSMDIALVLASLGMLCMAQTAFPAIPLLQPGLEERLLSVIYEGARNRPMEREYEASDSPAEPKVRKG